VGFSQAVGCPGFPVSRTSLLKRPPAGSWHPSPAGGAGPPQRVSTTSAVSGDALLRRSGGLDGPRREPPDGL